MSWDYWQVCLIVEELGSHLGLCEFIPSISLYHQASAQKIANYLREHDPSIPRVKFNTTDFDLLTGYLGKGYGDVTPEAEKAMNQAAGQIKLETTYTGKTLAACLDYCKEAAEGEKILFWNSYNSAAFERSYEFSLLPEEIRLKL